jgi:hypothetical protein
MLGNPAKFAIVGRHGRVGGAGKGKRLRGRWLGGRRHAKEGHGSASEGRKKGKEAE